MNKKHIFSLTCLVFASIVFVSACSKPVEIKKEIQTKSDGTKEAIFYVNDKEVARQKLGKYGKVLETSGTIPDGIAKEYYPNGQVKAVIPYKDGKIHGLAKTYYESGKLSWEGNLKEGKFHGSVKKYHENGIVSWQGNYKNSNLDGQVIGHHKNGLLNLEVTFIDGKREGVAKHYYDNGQLKYEDTYKDGKRQGLSKNYYENGRLKCESIYENDKQEGPSKEYYEDGSLRRSATYAKGKVVTDQHYGPTQTEYYSDLKKILALGDKIIKTVHKTGDVTYNQFERWYDRWKPAHDRIDNEYFRYRKDRKISYTFLDSRKALLGMESNAYMCKNNLWIDDSEKKRAQRSSYAEYTGKYKNNFWKEWNELLQDFANLKKAISERK